MVFWYYEENKSWLKIMIVIRTDQHIIQKYVTSYIDKCLKNYFSMLRQTGIHASLIQVPTKIRLVVIFCQKEVEVEVCWHMSQQQPVSIVCYSLIISKAGFYYKKYNILQETVYRAYGIVRILNPCLFVPVFYDNNIKETRYHHYAPLIKYTQKNTNNCFLVVCQI